MNGQQTALFSGFEVSQRATETGACTHRGQGQEMQRNLFSGAVDMVCVGCGATLAQGFQASLAADVERERAELCRLHSITYPTFHNGPYECPHYPTHEWVTP